MIAAAVPLVIIHRGEQVGRRKGWGVRRVFPLLRSPNGVLRVFGRTAGFMRAVTRFTQSRNWGRRLWSASNVEQPGSGCGLRKCGGVEEGVGGGGEERRCDGGGRGSMPRSDGGGSSGGEGEEAVRS